MKYFNIYTFGMNFILLLFVKACVCLNAFGGAHGYHKK